MGAAPGERKIMEGLVSIGVLLVFLAIVALVQYIILEVIFKQENDE